MLCRAYIVFDKFHVSQYVNRCLKRSEEDSAKAPGRAEISDQKHVRWLILRRDCNMTQWHHDRLEQLKQDNADLFEAHLIRRTALYLWQGHKQGSCPGHDKLV